ncbi:MAG: hypothetical protein OEM39_02185, partial [Acidimicrobiia bacterium]|nr:hypothetical protein [Acidimicrobiia bacterium]
LAGLSGAMLGYLVSRRKSRRLVEGVLVVGAVVGVVLLVVAAVAWLTQQPQHVWYPLALIGGILALVYGALIPTTRRNYQAAELSRMRALDA